MNRCKILVVEDDDLMRGMLQDSLSPELYNVTMSPDSTQGWDQYKKIDFDIVLLDLKLPKIDGITLLKMMKEYSPDPQIIMMTAYGTVETAVEAIKNGAFDYITKPFLSEELILLLQKADEFRKLKEENIHLHKELDERYSLDKIIGKSKPIQEVYRLIEVVAPTDTTVLVQGESGTGKELIADALHRFSPRKNKNIIKVSCAALPESLLQSELFGHEKGAFTDATKRKIGRLELAHQGTLFLDDVDDMSPSIQVKLLRALQEKAFERVGGTQTIHVDIRMVSASKVDLKEAVEKGTFREDLYYRLNVVPLVLPPLRDRKEDIPLLVKHFLEKFGKKMNKKVRIQSEVLDQLMRQDWPGNIRELENMVERLLAVTTKPVIEIDDLPFENTRTKKWSPVELKQVVQRAEKEHIQKVLNYTTGKKKEAAQILGITPKTLWQKAKEYHI